MSHLSRNRNRDNLSISLPKGRFLLVKLGKLLLGILLAGVFSLGLAGLLMHHGEAVELTELSAFQYWVVFLGLPSIAFGLFVFLSCLWVPQHKKFAGQLSIVLSLLFISYGVYQHYSDDGFLANQYILRYTGFILGLVISYSLSNKLFKLGTNRDDFKK